ncbi:MAG: extracellular solute-binding protein, partial [Clostridiaceae bacterium]|nr:extracellular solute-binding protein [Clostridiaceae bacterium]
MKRKALTVLLAAALTAGSLAGCAGGNSAPEKKAESTENTGTQAADTQAAGTQAASSEAQNGDNGTPASTGKVEFWNDKLSGTEQVDLDKLAQSASEASGINIEFISYTDVPSMRTAVEQSVNSSNAPGLFTWWSGVNLKNLVEAGAVEDLTEVWEEYIIPNGVSKDVADSLTFDGKIYAAPYSII